MRSLAGGINAHVPAPVRPVNAGHAWLIAATGVMVSACLERLPDAMAHWEAKRGSFRMPLKLVIGNKNYSSWSMRPWLALRASDIAFEEIFIPLYTGDADKKRILDFSTIRARCRR